MINRWPSFSHEASSLLLIRAPRRLAFPWEEIDMSGRPLSPQPVLRATRSLLAFSVAFAAVGSLLGCSGGSSPTAPEATPQSNAPAADLIAEPQISSISEAVVTGSVPVGAYEITLDLDAMTGEITTNRIAQAPATGTKYVVNLMELFTQDPCTDCLQLNSLRYLPGGDIALNLSMTHPFAAPDITGGVGTALFHVNNLRGFAIVDTLGPDGFPSGDDPDTFTPTGLNLGSPIGFDDDLQNVVADFLVNPDGYSRDVNPIIAPGFDTIHPYVVFGADDGTVGFGNFGVTGWSGTDLENPTGFNVFPQGSTIDADLTLNIDPVKIGVNQVKFQFILTCSYVVSRKAFDGLGDIQDPLYFMPEGALMSAWRVTVDNQGTDGLGAPPREGSNDMVTLEVGVRDWQKSFGTIVPALTETTTPTGVLGRSFPGELGVDIPGITATPLRYVLNTSPQAGTEADPVTQTVTFNNEPTAPEGRYVGFLKVVDERSNSPIIGAGETQELFETGGINADLTPYNLTSDTRSYATYQTFDYIVGQRPVFGSIDYATASLSGRVVVDMRGTTVQAPESIMELALVFDYGGNPIEFDTPDATSPGLIYAGTHTYAASGLHTLGLRVTDTIGRTDIVTYLIDVLPNRTPMVGAPPRITALAGSLNPEFGNGAADWEDILTDNPRGAENMLVLGDNVYGVFWMRPNPQPQGLYLMRSTSAGAAWDPPALLQDAAGVPDFAGASIAGGHDSTANEDHIYVALGTLNYNAGSGQPADVEIYENLLSGGGSFVRHTVSNTTSPTRHAAIAPALAVNPNDHDEVHLAFGFDTGLAANSDILDRVELRSSITGASGLVSDAAFLIDQPAYLTSFVGGIWSIELAQHPVDERVTLLLGENRATHLVRSDDNGTTWNVGSVETFNHAGAFYRDADLTLDPWLVDQTWILRQRRGSGFGNTPTLTLLRASGGSISLVDQVRGGADFGGVPAPLSAHPSLLIHPTGEIESYWTEGDPAGGANFDQSPHIEHDLALGVFAPSFQNDPDLLLDSPITNRGMNPSAKLSDNQTVMVLWVDDTTGAIYFRRG